MCCRILSLPDDILLAIFSRLRVEDLLSLLQTCRVFHEQLGSSDYVWHPIDIDLPLDIPPGKDVRLISGPELRQAWIKALYLDRIWCQHASQPKKMSRIMHGDIVFQTQFMDSGWLITLSRSPTSALCLSLWYIGTPSREYRYTSLDVPYASKFAATSRKDGTEAIIAVVLDAAHATNINVFTIPLNANKDNCGPSLIRQISVAKTTGTPGELHICENMVGIAIARFDKIFNPPTYRFIVLDIDTGNQLMISPTLPDHFTHVQFRLFPRHLIIAGLKNHEQLTVLTYDFSAIRTRLASCPYPFDQEEASALLGEVLSEEEADDVPADSDYTLSERYILRDQAPRITSLVFHASGVSSIRHGTASVFSFPSARDLRCPHGSMPVHVFSTPANAASDIVCLGQTGHRAVWLERRWDTDSFCLMKATFSPEGNHAAVVERLLPAHIALPFEIFSCQSIAFDEATGRVCLGLHTGELYILHL